MAVKKKGPAKPANRSTIASLRNNFLTGLIVVAPVVITIYLTWTIITFVDAQVVPLVPPPLRIDIGLPGFGVVIFLIFTTAVGYFTKNLFGRQLIKIGESWVDRMPIVRSIYNALKQIVETIFNQSNASFQQACLVEYPRKGIWAIAFVSTDTKGEIAQKVGGDDGMMSVFLPTTPNPTSGFLLFVHMNDIVFLDMSVEEAAKLVISAGLVTPPTKEEREAARQAALRRNGNGNGRGNGNRSNGNGNPPRRT